MSTRFFVVVCFLGLFSLLKGFEKLAGILCLCRCYRLTWSKVHLSPTFEDEEDWRTVQVGGVEGS